MYRFQGFQLSMKIIFIFFGLYFLNNLFIAAEALP